MKVLREVRIKTDRIEVGDRIKVRFFNEKHHATAIRDEGDEMLFLLDDCLDVAKPMNKEGGTEGGYEKSDLRKYLIQRAIELPEKLMQKMVPFENGDYLRLLSLEEACGCDAEWNDCEGQIPWMKDRRHRIATRKGDECEWYWLRDVASSPNFAIVAAHGGASAYSASYSHGVRPAFKIRNPESIITAHMG